MHRVGRYWGQPRYYEGFPCLTAEAAEYVASLGLKGVGEDSISLDPCDTTDYPNHMILLGAGLVNTENLTGLEALVGKTFTFLTLPLKWEHADGSSCRAMAMLREEETR
ncbi:MAG: cyclase family protein [Oscillospiraceae bacterium]